MCRPVPMSQLLWTRPSARVGHPAEPALDARCRRLTYALGRLPRRLVVFTVDVANVGHADILTPAVAGAVPCVIDAVHAELCSYGIGVTVAMSCGLAESISP